MAARRPDRRGFALIAAIVFVAILAVLATVITVNLSGDNDAQRIRKTADTLRRLAQEIRDPSQDPSFWQQVGRNPGRLSQLVIPITSTSPNACGATFSGGQAGNWRGPYHLVPIPTTGYRIAPGFLANDVLTANGATLLPIVMNNVAITDAQDLGLVVDNVSTGAGPTVTFTPNGVNPVTVSYNVAINSACGN